MASVYSYMVFITGLSVILALAGVQNGASSILNATGLLDNPSGFENSTLYQTIYLVLVSLGIGGIFIGSLLPQKSDALVMAGVTLMFLGFGLDLVNVWSYMNSTYNDWTKFVVGLLLIPLIVGYASAIKSYYSSGG